MRRKTEILLRIMILQCSKGELIWAHSFFSALLFSPPTLRHESFVSLVLYLDDSTSAALLVDERELWGTSNGGKDHLLACQVNCFTWSPVDRPDRMNIRLRKCNHLNCSLWTFESGNFVRSCLLLLEAFANLVIRTMLVISLKQGQVLYVLFISSF